MKFINESLEKFSRLSMRERLLVLLVSVVVLYFVFDTLLFTPQQKRIQQLQQSAQAHKTEFDIVNAKLVVMEADKVKGADQLQRQREEIAALQQQIAAAERFYSAGDQSKAGLTVLLPKLLASNLNVSLVDLKTQAPAVFFSSAQQTKQAKPGPTTKSNALQPSPSTPVNQSTIYRSAVDVSLEGSFPDLLSYLKTLEQRSAPLFWTGAVLEVKTYPQVALKLNITTLGVEAGSPLN